MTSLDTARYGYEAPASAELFARGQRVTPGGVNSPVRAFRAVGGTPRFMATGSGPWITDVDGRRYVDLVASWGPLILGHAHPAVVDAVTVAARRGLSFGAPTEGELALAEAIIDRMLRIAHEDAPSRGILIAVGVPALLLSTFAPQPVLVAGLVACATVGAAVLLDLRAAGAEDALG